MLITHIFLNSMNLGRESWPRSRRLEIHLTSSIVSLTALAGLRDLRRLGLFELVVVVAVVVAVVVVLLLLLLIDQSSSINQQ